MHVPWDKGFQSCTRKLKTGIIWSNLKNVLLGNYNTFSLSGLKVFIHYQCCTNLIDLIKSGSSLEVKVHVVIVFYKEDSDI